MDDDVIVITLDEDETEGFDSETHHTDTVFVPRWKRKIRDDAVSSVLDNHKSTSEDGTVVMNDLQQYLPGATINDASSESFDIIYDGFSYNNGISISDVTANQTCLRGVDLRHTLRLTAASDRVSVCGSTGQSFEPPPSVFSRLAPDNGFDLRSTLVNTNDPLLEIDSTLNRCHVPKSVLLRLDGQKGNVFNRLDSQRFPVSSSQPTSSKVEACCNNLAAAVSSRSLSLFPKRNDVFSRLSDASTFANDSFPSEFYGASNEISNKCDASRLACGNTFASEVFFAKSGQLGPFVSTPENISSKQNFHHSSSGGAKLHFNSDAFSGGSSAYNTCIQDAKNEDMCDTTLLIDTQHSRVTSQFLSRLSALSSGSSFGRYSLISETPLPVSFLADKQNSLTYTDISDQSIKHDDNNNDIGVQDENDVTIIDDCDVGVSDMHSELQTPTNEDCCLSDMTVVINVVTEMVQRVAEFVDKSAHCDKEMKGGRDERVSEIINSFTTDNLNNLSSSSKNVGDSCMLGTPIKVEGSPKCSTPMTTRLIRIRPLVLDDITPKKSRLELEHKQNTSVKAPENRDNVDDYMSMFEDILDNATFNEDRLDSPIDQQESDDIEIDLDKTLSEVEVRLKRLEATVLALASPSVTKGVLQDHTISNSTCLSKASPVKALTNGSDQTQHVTCDKTTRSVVSMDVSALSPSKITIEPVKTVTKDKLAAVVPVKKTCLVQGVPKSSKPESVKKPASKLSTNVDSQSKVAPSVIVDNKKPAVLPKAVVKSKPISKQQTNVKSHEATTSKKVLPAKQQTTRKAKEENSSSEKRDINDPEWMSIRNIRNDADLFKAVRRKWNSKKVPNPNRDLSVHNFRRRHGTSSSTATTVAPSAVAGQKRKATGDPMQASKQRCGRVVSISDYYDHRIRRLGCEREEELNRLQATFARERGKLFREIDNCYYNNPQRKCMLEHQLLLLSERLQADVNSVLNKYRLSERNLKEVRDETLSFAEAYQGRLVNNENPMELDYDALRHGIEVQSFLELYSQAYDQR